jgi:hypothetical protein
MKIEHWNPKQVFTLVFVLLVHLGTLGAAWLAAYRGDNHSDGVMPANTPLLLHNWFLWLLGNIVLQSCAFMIWLPVFVCVIHNRSAIWVTDSLTLPWSRLNQSAQSALLLFLLYTILVRAWLRIICCGYITARALFGNRKMRQIVVDYVAVLSSMVTKPYTSSSGNNTGPPAEVGAQIQFNHDEHSSPAMLNPTVLKSNLDFAPNSPSPKISKCLSFENNEIEARYEKQVRFLRDKTPTKECSVTEEDGLFRHPAMEPSAKTSEWSSEKSRLRVSPVAEHSKLAPPRIVFDDQSSKEKPTRIVGSDERPKKRTSEPCYPESTPRRRRTRVSDLVNFFLESGHPVR